MILSFFSGVEPSVPNPKGSDIYLVSYPKSGNTWLRYLLTYAIWPDLGQIDLVDMARLVPSFNLQHDAEAMLDPNAPCNRLPHRIIKEHFAYNRIAKKYVQNTIYLVRDGRDAIVSYWHFCNERDSTNISFKEFIKLSASPNHSYGPWGDHVRGWQKANLNSYILIRYEDMLHDTAGCLRDLLNFIGISRNNNIIEQAVEKASFKSMKKIEQEKGLNLDQLKKVNFIRQGKAGSWEEVFDVNDLEIFNSAHKGPIPELGYKW